MDRSGAMTVVVVMKWEVEAVTGVIAVSEVYPPISQKVTV